MLLRQSWKERTDGEVPPWHRQQQCSNWLEQPTYEKMVVRRDSVLPRRVSVWVGFGQFGIWAFGTTSLPIIELSDSLCPWVEAIMWAMCSEEIGVVGSMVVACGPEAVSASLESVFVMFVTV